jgi:FkbH-like protein
MEQLDWLPPHRDLSAAIRAARAEISARDQLAAACTLSGFRRDFLATERINRVAKAALDRLEGGEGAALGLKQTRIALLGSHTLLHLEPGIRVAGLARGLAIEVHVGGYNLYRQELLSGDAALANFRPNFLLLALDEAAIGLSCSLEAPASQIEAKLDQEIGALKQLWRSIRERYGAQPIQQTLLRTTVPIFGNYEGLISGSPGALWDAFNARLRKAARDEKVLLLDIDWEAARRGLIPELVDPVRWHHAKQLVSPLFTPLFGDLLARVLAAATGVSRKCLVLDLDNTLWGGVLGDDGIGSLRLGQGSADGEAYTAFQRHVAHLGRRGIILAVCSKNDPEFAERAFSSHSEMVLKRDDIAVFAANWDDKATNLRKIAKTLDLGTDALVFVDDNPAEREIVRTELPQVAVPEMPDDIANYPRRLANAGYFETASFTADDLSRGRSYAARSRRLAEMEHATDLDGYLRKLEMSMKVEIVGPENIVRVAQLVNKTNQFNLTTRRYTAEEIERLAAAPGNLALAFRLRDRLEDAGLIAVIFATPADTGEMYIDTWLMSCRVLGRQVEAASLEALVNLVQCSGNTTLIGKYIPTARNALVANHYRGLGFLPVVRAVAGPKDKDTTVWRFTISEPLPPHHIAVDMGRTLNHLPVQQSSSGEWHEIRSDL